ncbi:MAG: hypothetical protein IT371_23260 [Deltaproteobacteria bacterium]|nr:hypothetical protein [Deltaproteobacteria bacterium]
MQLRRAIVLAFVLVGWAGPALARQVENLETRYPRGESIGVGAGKEVFAVVGRPELALVVARMHPWALDHWKQELRLQKVFARLGFPVVEVLELGKSGDGRPAMVQPRYAMGTKDYCVRGGRRLVSARTASDWARLLELGERHGIWPQDPQGLLGFDGSLVLADFGYGLNIWGRGSPEREAALQELRSSGSQPPRIDGGRPYVLQLYGLMLADVTPPAPR